jgi:hypothetical protein
VSQPRISAGGLDWIMETVGTTFRVGYTPNRSGSTMIYADDEPEDVPDWLEGQVPIESVTDVELLCLRLEEAVLAHERPKAEPPDGSSQAVDHRRCELDRRRRDEDREARLATYGVVAFNFIAIVIHTLCAV